MAGQAHAQGKARRQGKARWQGWARCMACALAALAMCAALATRIANAEPSAPAPATAQVDAAAQFIASLHPQKGDVKLPNGIVTLHLGQAYYYLSPKDAERVLVEAWGNPPGTETQGMIFPASMQPTNPEAWGIVLTYVEDGHVDDADAGDIDYAAMLKDLQEDTAAANEQRKAEGYPAMTLVGWAEPPHYDAERHALHWAKDLQAEGVGEHTLNYNVRTLGRRGVLEMNFVAGMTQLPKIKRNINAVLAVPEYEEGHRYIDFDPEVDQVAAYGLGALVAGKVATKLGLLAGGLVLLKKFWFLLAGGGAWLWSRLRGRTPAGSTANAAGGDVPPPPPTGTA